MEGVKASDAAEEDKYNIEFDERGPVGLALRNHIIMKMIVNFLNDGELDSWYESCMFVKRIIDEMGDSIWTGRVERKLVVWEGILSLEMVGLVEGRQNKLQQIYKKYDVLDCSINRLNTELEFVLVVS